MRRSITTLFCLICLCSAALAQGHGEQIPNMHFDHWSRKGGEWCPWAADAPESMRAWGTANKGLSILGKNGVEPEEKFVAVSGSGKKAMKLHSEKVLWAFASGSAFTGSFLRLIGTKGAEISEGISFHSRPKALSGYYCYKPGRIDNVRKGDEALKGRRDEGKIEVVLLEGNSPIIINSVKGDYFDAARDPRVIGRGVLHLEATKGYVRFELPIEYRDSRTPGMVILEAAASCLGGGFTGADGTELYIDEFEFKY